MFEIYKGGEHFYQWDTGQRLLVKDAEIVQVHFCNRTDDCSLVTNVYTEGGKRLVNVPNILLQSANNIRVYGCIREGDKICFGKCMQVFRVIAKSKPEGYAYTETDILNYATLDARITELENSDFNLDGIEARVAALEKTNNNYTELEERVEALEDTGFNYSDYNLPIVYLNGDTTGISKDNKVTLNYIYGERSGTCTLKWQGSSAIQFPKKNYTITFDNAFEAKEGWGSQKKYCLKADWVDYSHARNIVSARLWGDVVRTRTPSAITEKLATAPNYGAIDGFPCSVVINGEWQGVYNFNIPKDNWMMSMGSGTKEAILCAEKYSDPTLFNTLATVGVDFELEYNSDTFNQAEVQASLNNLTNAILNHNSTNVYTTVAQYLDIDSAVDYFIFAKLLHHADGVGKNYLLCTYDGVKWFLSAYDMDLVFGADYPGDHYFSADAFCNVTGNKLFSMIWYYCPDKLFKRYHELTGGVLSAAAVEEKFMNYSKDIPAPAFIEDAKLWATIPCTYTSNHTQSINWYSHRIPYIDAEMAEREMRLGTAGLQISSGAVTGVGSCIEENIVIPSINTNGSGIYSVGVDAFNGNNFIETLTIVEGTQAIKNTACMNCTALKRVYINSSVFNSIGYRTFEGCTALRVFEIPHGVTGLTDRAFHGCSSLATISIPKSITTIGAFALRYCSKLTTILYAGTTAEWQAISKGTEWDVSTGAYTVYCTDGNIAKA